MASVPGVNTDTVASFLSEQGILKPISTKANITCGMNRRKNAFTEVHIGTFSRQGDLWDLGKMRIAITILIGGER